MKKQNAGISLVELIVVFAILAVISAASVIGISSIFGARVSQCSSLISSTVKETRMNALSKSAAVFSISYDTVKKNFVISDSAGSSEATGDAQTQITCDLTDDNGDVQQLIIDGTAQLKLSFERGSGSFLPAIASVNADGSYVYQTNASGNLLYCSSITITRGSKSKTLNLVRDTGKIYE